MILGSSEFLSTILDIYSAPGCDKGWQRSVASINALVGGRASVYLLVSEDNLANQIRAVCGFREADVAAYEGPNGAAKDVRFRYLHNLVPGEVFREFEYVTDRSAWDASEWIRYQREHLGCYWCMSARVSRHGLWQDYLSINRLESKGPHTDDEKQALQALLPHLARSAELHRTLTSLEQRYGAVLSVLDRLLVGLIILDRNGKLAVANSAAREACERRGALRITREGRLIANSACQDEVLQSLLVDVTQTATGQGRGDGGQLTLTREGQSLIAEVVPLRDDGLPDRFDLQGAAVFLIDPSLSHVVNIEGIARIFELTSAETAVADSIVNGHSVADVADQRGSSVETVRKQLKAIFRKTGAGSQLELLRLATKSTPPLR